MPEKSKKMFPFARSSCIIEMKRRHLEKEVDNMDAEKKKEVLRGPEDICTAVCPICGSDLSFQDNECICKNKACSWHCEGCKSKDDI